MKVDPDRFLFPQEPYPCWEFFTPFSRPEENPANASAAGARRFFWARNAIYWALKALSISPKAHVVLPAYLCKAAVEPFLEYGSEVEFYGVNRRCEPDFSEIASKIGKSTEVVMAVHYFGFPQDLRKFRELCDRHSLMLLEDCAHALPLAAKDTPIGRYGDASVFSWRKFLPLHDGGELRLKNNSIRAESHWQKEGFGFSLRILKHQVDRMLDGSPGRLATAASATIDLAKRGWMRRSHRAASDPQTMIDPNSSSFDLPTLDLPMSRVSRWLLRHSDMGAIVERRRENYLYLQAGLRSIGALTVLHPELPANVCPWVFPVVFDRFPGVHRLLRQEGIPATAWDFVRPEGVRWDAFADANFLYEHLTFLPVHQNLTRNSLDLIIAAVRRICAATVPQNAKPEYVAG